MKRALFAVLLASVASSTGCPGFETCCMRPAGCCYDAIGPKAAAPPGRLPAPLDEVPAPRARPGALAH